MSSRLTVLSIIVACSAASRVAADETHPALHWTRAESAAECVDPRTLAELVETYTGPVLVAPAAADVSIEGAIERSSPEEFRMRVSLTVKRGRPAGERVLQLRAADCRKLDGAIAFVIATTLDPDLGSGTLPPELSWLQPTETAPAEQLRGELASAPPSQPRAELQPLAAGDTRKQLPPPSVELPSRAQRQPFRAAWELGIAAAFGTTPLPSSSGGAVLTIGRTLTPWFSLAAQLRGNASLGGVELAPHASIEAEAFTGAVLACSFTGGVGSIGFQACLGPELGFTRAHGVGLSDSHTIYQTLVGGSARLELRFPIGEKLSIATSALFAVDRRTHTVYRDLGDLPEAFQSRVASIQGAVGLTRTF
jgi:hypothetical protein